MALNLSKREAVGETRTATLEVSDDAIETFADVSGDHNPLHLDDEVAEQTMFRGRIAHGMLPEASISAALADLPGVVAWVSKQVDYLKPVRPGETVTAEVEIAELTSDGYHRVHAHVTDSGGDVVIDSTHTVLLDGLEDESEPVDADADATGDADGSEEVASDD